MKKPESRTIPLLLAEMAGQFGDRNFVTDGGRHLSYADFQAETRRLAKGLHALGVRRGDKVALLMGNQLEWLLVDFAVAMLGGLLVAVNTWWRQYELQHALSISESSVLIMVDRYLNNDYCAALRGMGDLAQALPRLRRIVCLGPDAPDGALPFDEIYALGESLPDAVIDVASAAVQPDELALLGFTSGSTSRSKAAGLAHRGLIENPYGIGERMHLTERDRVLLVVSMFWGFANTNALFAAITHGASIVLQFRYDPAEMLRLIEQERCTAVYTQPNMVIALHNHPDRHWRDLSSWRTGLCRPQVMPLLEEMGVPQMITSYGLTECYGNSCNSDAEWPSALRRIGSGTPLPGTELQIVDPNTRTPLPQSEVGEIRLRGYVTPGYYNDPARTAEAIDAEGWFYTGDLGLLEEHGILVFRGRIKEIIKTGGINVTAADVEEVLEQHEAVRQAVVVGVPDPERDEIVAAMVVLREGAQANAAELMQHCRETVAVYKVPRHIEFVRAGDVPLTDTGKIAKRLVQDRLAASYRVPLTST